MFEVGHIKNENKGLKLSLLSAVLSLVVNYIGRTSDGSSFHFINLLCFPLYFIVFHTDYILPQ